MQPTDLAIGAGQVPGLIWAAPFLGVLGSIALLPALAPRFWHRRMAWVAAFWSLALLIPEAIAANPGAAVAGAWHAILVEYLPFITLLLALFTTGGGVLVRGGASGTPAGNTGLLAIGTLLAGVMGTTGAAMVLIHPLLRANAHRERKMHLVVFFIVLVANAGGALSPLGDPPLYLGFLRRVPFSGRCVIWACRCWSWRGCCWRCSGRWISVWPAANGLRRGRSGCISAVGATSR